MISGVMQKKLIRRTDERGFFVELIRNTDPFFLEGFAQLSHSFMRGGIVKAWHIHKTQVDWWYAVGGVIQAVLCDLRDGSPTYKKIDEFLLGKSGEDFILKIPAGVAHGCKILEGPADLIYITSVIYTREEEGRIPYNDPDIGYDWVQGIPITNMKIT